MSRVRDHYTKLNEYATVNNLEIVALFLQGSQNYNMDEYSDEYSSDVDTKAIVIPSLKNIIDGTSPISTTLVLDNNEHIDIKDIRTWVTMWEKENISYLEILFTKFYIINQKYEDLMEKLISWRNKISRMNKIATVKCMGGMSREKIHALKHPYPNAVSKLEKYGYDPKQLHHICRINELLKRYISGESLDTAYIPKDINYLMEIKKGVLSEEEATNLAISVDTETLEIVNKFSEENSVSVDMDTKNFLYDIKREIITRYLRNLFI